MSVIIIGGGDNDPVSGTVAVNFGDAQAALDLLASLEQSGGLTQPQVQTVNITIATLVSQANEFNA